MIHSNSKLLIKNELLIDRNVLVIKLLYLTLFYYRRILNRRSISDLTRDDFTSDSGWDTVQYYIEENKKKQRALNQQIARLNEKVASLKAVIDHVNKTRSLSKEVRDEIEKTI